MNWALKGARSRNEDIKGKGIPGGRNGTSKGTAMMELRAGSRSWGWSSNEAGGKTKMSGSSYSAKSRSITTDLECGT